MAGVARDVDDVTLGVLVHDYAPENEDFDVDSENAFAYSAGAGVTTSLSSSIGLFAEARYMAADDTQFIPIFVGLTIMSGGSSAGQ